jgi:hypothetical protein
MTRWGDTIHEAFHCHDRYGRPSKPFAEDTSPGKQFPGAFIALKSSSEGFGLPLLPVGYERRERRCPRLDVGQVAILGVSEYAQRLGVDEHASTVHLTDPERPGQPLGVEPRSAGRGDRPPPAGQVLGGRRFYFSTLIYRSQTQQP